MGKLQVFRKALQSYFTLPIVTFLAKTKITPNMVTWFGFLLILVATGLAATGHLFASGWVILLSGVFDMLDGALARHTNQVTRFGGVLDSTLDRLSEAAILLGIMAYYLSNPMVYHEWIVLVIGVALVASFLVSYIRSRAEAANIDCQVGIFTRVERVIILALGLLINQLPIILSIIAFMSVVTVIQRMVHVYRKAGKG
jgi:CDP-diacylglycerol---glycerol-3-phosphate 3-phosphatidyltransferase